MKNKDRREGVMPIPRPPLKEPHQSTFPSFYLLSYKEIRRLRSVFKGFFAQVSHMVILPLRHLDGTSLL